MATKPKAILSAHDGREASPITKTSNVLFENGQTAQDILNDRQDAMISPVIENSSSMFKVGQGDGVDYSSNVVDGAYESMVLKGKSMVNCIQEPSSQDVVLPYEFEEGQYVTINDTKESGALGVELKGQTLVNLVGWNNIKTLDFGSISNNVATINFEHYYATMTIKTGDMIKQNTTYTFIIDSKVTKSEVDAHDNPPRQNGVIIYFTDGTFQTPMTSFQNVGERVLQKIVFTIENKEIQQIHIRLFTASLGTIGACQGEVYSVMLIEGDYTNNDIPYFEGMASCKMPTLHTVGKNLFDINKCKPSKPINDNGNEVTGSTPNHYAYGEFIPINNEFTISITSDNGSVPNNANGTRLRFYDKNKNLVDSQWFAQSFKESNGRKYCTISMNGAKYLKINFNATGGNADTTYEAMKTIQIENGSSMTSYEPHKSSILSLPE